jgi:hypothetical protein
MMATKKMAYEYTITLRPRKGDEPGKNVVVLSANRAFVTDRGDLCLTNSAVNAFTHNVVAAFKSGSWINLMRSQYPNGPAPAED